MSPRLGNRRTGSKVGKVLRKLTTINENITNVVNQGSRHNDLDIHNETFKMIVAAMPFVYFGKRVSGQSRKLDERV